MNLEKVTWAALSGAVLTVFWPWMLAQQVLKLTVAQDDSIQE